jgi:hypothetical protein
MNNRLINTKVAGGGGGCTDIVDNYDPFDGNGVALYQLNGDATDVSGNYDGTTVTDVTWGGEGQFGTSGSFNGSSSRIAIPNIVNQAADHTASIWVKPTDFNANRGALSMFNGSHLLVYITTDAGLNSGGAASSAGSTAGTLTAGVWNHIVFTYNYATTTYTMYVNGVNRGVDVNFNFSGRPNSIGCHNGGSSFTAYFNGSIDQVRIFNTALTPLEVEALYTEELCICDGTVDTLDILGDGSCIATYQLDGNANDLSGNYSGTPTNVSYGVGEFDLAGVFNGTSSKIDFNSSILPSSGGFAISWWMKWNGDSDYAFLFDTSGGGAGNGMYCIVHDVSDKIYWNFKNSSYGTNIEVAYPVSERTEWTHFVISWDGTTASNSAKIYKNTIATSGTQSVTQTTSQSNFKIGYVGVENFNGSIDQVRIFNKALSAGEVTTLYNETACSVEPTPLEEASFYLNPRSITSDGAITIWQDEGTIGRDFYVTSSGSGTIQKAGTGTGIEYVKLDTYNQGRKTLNAGSAGEIAYSDYSTQQSFTIGGFWNIQSGYLTNTDYPTFLTFYNDANNRYGLSGIRYNIAGEFQIDSQFYYGSAVQSDARGGDLRPYPSWKFVCVTFDYNPSGTSTNKVYIDGTLVGTNTFTGTTGASTSVLKIGGLWDTAYNYGDIYFGDVFGFMGTVKSQSEIVAIYNEYKSNYGL